jgi:hypothetical protein
MAFQNTVVENEIGFEIVLINEYSLLAGLEAETAAHLKEELLQMVKYCRL